MPMHQICACYVQKRNQFDIEFDILITRLKKIIVKIQVCKRERQCCVEYLTQRQYIFSAVDLSFI